MWNEPVRVGHSCPTAFDLDLDFDFEPDLAIAGACSAPPDPAAAPRSGQKNRNGQKRARQPAAN